jgi:hypothetical protein
LVFPFSRLQKNNPETIFRRSVENIMNYVEGFRAPCRNETTYANGRFFREDLALPAIMQKNRVTLR